MGSLPQAAPEWAAGRGRPDPWLVQICLRDTVAPVSSARAAARRAGSRATVKEFDLGHFDIDVGEGFEGAVRDQIQFLTSALQAPLPAAL